MQPGEHAVKVLNSLIETTLDSAEGYKEAAQHTSNPTFRTMFAERSQRRRELGRQLQDEVRSFGARPEEDQSTVGKLHNKFVGLREKLAGGGDKAVIDEVERGEDVIKAKFLKAADDANLPTDVRDRVVAWARAVKAEHDEIAAIKHSMH